MEGRARGLERGKGYRFAPAPVIKAVLNDECFPSLKGGHDGYAVERAKAVWVVADRGRRLILIVAPFLAIPNEDRQRISLSEVATLVQTGCDPILRVSIVPRGTHLGYTLSLPEDDRHLRTRAELKEELAGLLAGWVAEQLVFGEASTHAAGDLRQASALARRMVTRFGMSKKLGPLTYGQRHEQDFLGQEIGGQRDYSQATARAIDAEVEQLVTGACRRARTLLAGRRSTLDRLARRLLEEETVDGGELAVLVARREGDAV